MIQDIYPKKLNNSFKPEAKASEDSLIFAYDNGAFLLRIDEISGAVVFPKLKDFKCDFEMIYLFEISGEEFFYANGFDKESCSIPAGYEFCSLKQLRSNKLNPQHYVFACYTAFQLINWYECNKFCGKCGTANELSTTERALICPKCGHTRYPRINPAVIVGVRNGDKLLLTKYRTGFAHNALVAGFTEIGETMEETVKREVMEETGLKVKNITYYKSQPWGVASDILMGYFCDVDGDDTINMDTSELKYAEWVARNDIELQPSNYSLTNEMMQLFKNRQI